MRMSFYHHKLCQLITVLRIDSCVFFAESEFISLCVGISYIEVALQECGTKYYMNLPLSGTRGYRWPGRHWLPLRPRHRNRTRQHL